MARFITPSPSSRFARTIDLPADDDDLRAVHDDDVIAKNRMVILELEQKYHLTPGILTIKSSGQLEADLSHEEPDQGTKLGMVEMYPALPLSEDHEPQIPSWLRDYLIKELNLFGSGPPFACSSLYDQMVTSREVGEGTNLSVSSTALLISCATVSLRYSITDLRDFCSSGEAICEDTYAMEFGIVEGVIKRLAGWDKSESVQSRILASGPTENKTGERSPAKRRKIIKDNRVGVNEGGTVPSRELPSDIQLLLDLGSKGMVMKGALDDSLEERIITPVSRLVEKLDNVYKGLRRQEEEEKKKKDQRMGGDHSSDSGVSACSP